MMLSKALASLLCLAILLAPFCVFADEWAPTPSDMKGKVSSLERGDRAPFAGILMDQVAVIKILTEKKEAELRHEANMKKLEAEYEAELKLLRATMEAQTEYEKERLDAAIRTRDDQIDGLTAELEESLEEDSSWVWWFVGGIAIGAAAAGGTAALIFYVD